jgi:putative transposase
MLMRKKRKKWTTYEKESILKDIQRVGVVAGCRKHNISTRTYYDWLDKYNAEGVDGLDRQAQASVDAELKQLRKENRLLKEMLAEKELEARLKDDLLKKRWMPGTTTASGHESRRTGTNFLF